MRKATLAIVGFLAIATGAEAGLQYNGTQINGTQINGTQINGTQINGTQINGTQINGTQINGTQINGTQINGTQINGTLIGATPSSCGHIESASGGPLSTCSSCAQIVANYDSYCGTVWWDSICASEAASLCKLNVNNFVGSIWTANMKDGSTVQLKINGYTQLSGANSDLYSYDLRYLHCGWVYNFLSGGYVWLCSWNEVCPSQTVCNSRGSICTTFGSGAIPIKGSWDGTNPGGKDPGTESTSITFSCRNGAISKCMEYEGYRPWKTYWITNAGSFSCTSNANCSTGATCRNGVCQYALSGDSTHQACVRMLRADYCGDGTTHTFNETPIDVYDGEGVQSDDYSESTLEAAWAPNGATCVVNWRYPTTSEVNQIITNNNIYCPNNGRTYWFGDGACDSSTTKCTTTSLGGSGTCYPQIQISGQQYSSWAGGITGAPAAFTATNIQ